MSQMTLRQLARAYAEGELDKDSYREARAELIAGILAGDIPVHEHENLPPVRTRRNDATLEQATERRSPKKKATEATGSRQSPSPAPPKKPAAPAKKSGRSALIAGIVIGVLLLVITVYYIGFTGEEDTAAGEAGDSAMDTGAPDNTAGHELITTFLRNRTWTSESIDGFVVDWRALPASDREAAAGSAQMGRLTNAIYKQLLEERALSGLDNGEAAVEKQRQLVEFARSVGIDDPRISLPDATDRQPPAGPAEDEADTREQTAPATIGPQSSTESCRQALAPSRAPYCRDLISAAGEYAPTMVIIQPGRFIMGGNGEQEQPRHRVVIDYPFAVSMHEITFGEFSLFCRMTHRNCPDQPWAGKDYPVVNVTWHQARDYTRWLTDNTGRQYRLPSEAEWEYVARAGTQTPYPAGEHLTHQDAVFSGEQRNNGPLPKTDRRISRNPFQVYHMAGNVREWTGDSWHPDYNGAPTDGSAWVSADSGIRVVRGGSYADSSTALRSAARLRLPADNADRYTGFRVVREIENRDS